MEKSLFFRLAFFAAVLLITVLALLPPAAPMPTTGWDKANHCLAFFSLALALDHGYPRSPALWLKLGGLFGYGAVLEVLQGLTGYRDSAWLDLLANSTGLLLYLLLSSWLRTWLRQLWPWPESPS